ncbi:MAG: hypothetical protein ACE5GK_06960 [Nitrospiria bacterium]
MRYSALWVVVLMFHAGCGYSLEFSKVDGNENEPDPVTLMRRELRQLKADHRVAVFDLKKQYESLAQDQKKRGNQSQSDIVSLRKKDADFGEQLTEIGLQLRFIKGSMEEDVNRMKEVSEGNINTALMELRDIDRRLDLQKKNEEADRSRLQKQVDALQVRIEPLQVKIDALKVSNAALKKSSSEQITALNEVSAQVSELIEKMLPAINDLVQRIDKQEVGLEKMDRDVNVSDLNRRIAGLTEAVDVQRKSLEMLGNTITSQVDKQSRLLEKTIDRIDAFEKKSAKKSSP